MSKLSNEAKKAALQDMKEWLKENSWTFINVSVKTLHSERDRNLEDVYCRAGW